MSNYELLTDIQWQLLEPLFPHPVKRTRGKPHTAWRSVVNSIFYILFSGMKWGSLPVAPEFATKSAAHRWFVIWDKNGFLQELLNKHQCAATDIKLPHRRNRQKAVKHDLVTEVVAS
jgi:transposase